jgi:hypothetical protein
MQPVQYAQNASISTNLYDLKQSIIYVRIVQTAQYMQAHVNWLNGNQILPLHNGPQMYGRGCDITRQTGISKTDTKPYHI